MLKVIGLREAGLDEKSQQSMTFFYQNENVGEVVAVDIRVKLRDLNREIYGMKKNILLILLILSKRAELLREL